MRFSSNESQRIAELIASRQEGHSLPGDFYSDEVVYQADLASIWRRGWLFVGHTCEIPEPGDYVTFAIGDDSLMVIRDDDKNIQALWNVCRHRGTLICDAPAGKAGRLVCPYHQWMYRRGGSLLSCLLATVSAPTEQQSETTMSAKNASQAHHEQQRSAS